jgi:F-type H+-transporting ATPase subunit b
MKRAGHLVGAALAVVLLSAVALPALASGGEDAGSGMIWHVLNFGVLLAVLVVVARKPIVGFFADRREEITDDIDKAGALLDEATARHNEWQGKIVKLEAELETIRAQARHWAEDERDKILADARATAERIKREATASIEQEIRRAKDELAREASELSLELAAKLLREQVGEGDRDRLMDEFISSVERPRVGQATGE